MRERPVDGDEMASLYAELRQRQSGVEADAAQMIERWRTGGCSSSVAVARTPCPFRVSMRWRALMFFRTGGVRLGPAHGL